MKYYEKVTILWFCRKNIILVYLKTPSAPLPHVKVHYGLLSYMFLVYPYKLVIGVIKVCLGDIKLCVILLKLLTTRKTGLVEFVSGLEKIAGVKSIMSK